MGDLAPPSGRQALTDIEAARALRRERYRASVEAGDEDRAARLDRLHVEAVMALGGYPRARLPARWAYP